MALYPKEHQVIELHEKGLSQAEICAETGIGNTPVRAIVTHYCGPDEMTRHNRILRFGSAALLAAIERARTASQGVA